MNGFVSRRSVLWGLGAAGAMAQLLALARAGEASGEAKVCLSMLFLAGDKAKFDNKKYISRHIPLLRRIYGDTVERIELRTTTPAAQGFPSQVLATAMLWVTNPAAFAQKLQAGFAEINDDLGSFSKGDVMSQTERMVSSLGDARASVALNTPIVSMYYRAMAPGMGMPGMGGMGGGMGGMPGGPGRGGGGGGGGAGRGPGGGGPPGGANAAGGPAAPGGAPPAPPGPRFDLEYFNGTYIPRLHSLLGAAAVRRLEVTSTGKDVTVPVTTPTLIAASHLYVRDRSAYDSASQQAMGELMREGANFSTLFPLMVDSKVAAIG